MANRWAILCLVILLPIVFSLYFSTGIWLALDAVSLLSIVCFLAIFGFLIASVAFRAGVNPYVKDVDDMSLATALFNPMYFAWLWEKKRRVIYKFYTGVSFLIGFVFGEIFSYVATNRWQTVAQSDVSTGSLASFALITVFAISWYEGICKPRSPIEKEETEEQKPTEEEEEPKPFKFD